MSTLSSSLYRRKKKIITFWFSVDRRSFSPPSGGPVGLSPHDTSSLVLVLQTGGRCPWFLTRSGVSFSGHTTHTADSGGRCRVRRGKFGPVPELEYLRGRSTLNLEEDEARSQCRIVTGDPRCLFGVPEVRPGRGLDSH